MAWVAVFLVLQSDVTFKEASPKATKAEVKRRLHIEGDLPEYDVTKEKFQLVVPSEYAKDAGWGLFVWINAGDDPGIPRDLGPLLVKHKLLAIAAYKSGNDRYVVDRIRLAVDAAHNVQKDYTIDPKRVFVSGISGGGRIASMAGVAYADVFTGTFPICGVNFYKRIPLGGDKVLLSYYVPVAEVLKTAKASCRYVLMTGEKDFNHDQTKLVYDKGFKAEGFKNVLLIDVPGLEHAVPGPEWLEKGLTFIDPAK
jgi:hypothetical protein